MEAGEALAFLKPLLGAACDLAIVRYPDAMAEDLTPEYVATLRRMTGAQKLRTAFQLYWGARKIKAARLRDQHPDWTEEAVQQRVKEIFMHGVG